MQEKKDFEEEYLQCKSSLKEARFQLSEKEAEYNSLFNLHENAKKTIENCHTKIKNLSTQNNEQKLKIESLESDNINQAEHYLTIFQEKAEQMKEQSIKFSEALNKERKEKERNKSLHNTEMKNAEERYNNTGKFLPF